MSRSNDKTGLVAATGTNVSIIAYITKRQLLAYSYISTKTFFFFLHIGLSNIWSTLFYYSLLISFVLFFFFLLITSFFNLLVGYPESNKIKIKELCLLQQEIGVRCV